MTNYPLTTPEQATLDSLREEGAFGLEYNEGWHDNNAPQLISDEESDFDGTCSDEAAYALMVQRGLKELGESEAKHHDQPLRWNTPITLALYKVRIIMLEENCDILAAIIAALKE